ncbi:MAG: DUF222 domain-containing protein [Pseudomonadota bacterium]
MKAPNTVTERHRAIDELDRAIVNLSCQINAASYELLVLIREFDERAGWLKWGFANCTDWLHWRCDLSRNACREKIRIAHALKTLPAMSEVFSKGLLSYSKVRALTRVATGMNEASLVDFAMTTTAARVEERCRQMRNVHPDASAEAQRSFDRRDLSVWRNLDRGMMTITVQLPIEQGELIAQALDKELENTPDNQPENVQESFGAQQADAMVNIAREYLAGGSDSTSTPADNYQVVVHVDHSALTHNEGRSDLPVESVKRLTCDGSVIRMVDGPQGEPLSVGRKQRTIPTAIDRALWARDRGCRFPGCCNTRYVHAHHVKHWSHGGETSLDNLVLLCSRHHRLVHEGGYSLRTDYRGAWYFARPDGRAVPAMGYQPQDTTDDCLHTSAEVRDRAGCHASQCTTL